MNKINNFSDVSDEEFALSLKEQEIPKENPILKKEMRYGLCHQKVFD